jgi:hypothetical protein
LMIRPDSWLDVVVTLGAVVDAEGRTIPANTTRDGMDYVVVGCDLGNSAIKIVLRQADAPQLRMFRFEAVYTPAATIRAGEGATAHRVLRNAVWREWFWPDHDDPVAGETLPIGTTAERLADPRMADFLIGTLVEALGRSGRPPGAYTLWVGFGIPSEEISSVGLIAETRQALRQLRGQSFLVERRDGAGTVTTWSITIGELVPAAQSLGSFIAWYHTLAGQPAIDDVNHVTVADLGGGHLSRFDVEIVRRPGGSPQVRGTGGILGEGMVVIARALTELAREKYRVRLNETAALRALMTGTIPASGRPVSINDLIATAIHTRGQQVLAALTPLIADHRRLTLFVGGGVVRLGAELDARAAAAQRAPGSYLIVPASIASTSNAVGLFALAFYAVQRGA